MDEVVFLQAKEHLSQSDQVIANLITQYPDFTPRRAFGTPFEILCESIISQQLSVRSADAIWGKFHTRFGPVINPQAVLAASDDDLRRCGLSSQKTRYLRHLAESILDGTVTPADFPGMSDGDINGQLTRVKGIGPWTVHMYLIFGMGRPDVLPVDDYGLKQAIKTQYGLDQLPSRNTITQLGQAWQPYRSVACLYLWRSLDNKQQGSTES